MTPTMEEVETTYRNLPSRRFVRRVDFSNEMPGHRNMSIKEARAAAIRIRNEAEERWECDHVIALGLLAVVYRLERILGNAAEWTHDEIREEAGLAMDSAYYLRGMGPREVRA